MAFRLPDLSHRITINGRTGSGKSHFAAWLLSEAEFNKIPFVILDYKGDKLLNSISRAKYIGLSEKVPKEPGIYILRLSPYDADAVEEWLHRVYLRGRTGLFFDEALMVPNQRRDRSAFVAILTQGRSLQIPSIVLTQRPSHVSNYAFSEANFYALFALNDKKDIDRVASFAPVDDPEHPAWNLETKIAKYNCRWYDQEEHTSAIMKPAPSADKILARFDERLRPKRRWL